VSVVQKIYDGAYDDQGHHLLFGLERGGEAQWNLASTPTIEPPRAQLAAYQKAFVIFPEVTPALADFNKPIVFTKADFEMGETLAPLYNGTNTNLKPFAARGGKLILWHGLTDFLIPPKVTLAYYRGVQKFMGEKAADEVTRLFLIPGVGHCGGGDGYNQLDVLSPLMSWVESKQAPTEILTGKIAQRAGATNGNALQPTGPRPSKPYATPMPTLTATRPVYPYPFIARYTGNGDPNVAANYARAKSPVTPAQEFAFDYEAFKLIGPNSQHDYGVRDGRLVVVK
jgi:feruloyl esterase